MKRFVAVALAVVLLPLGASPAVAGVSSSHGVTAASPGEIGRPVLPRPVENKAGVREMIKATAIANSGLRSANSALALTEKLREALAAPSPSLTLIAKLEAKIASASTRAQAMFYKAEEMASKGYSRHEERAVSLAAAGRDSVDSPQWTSAALGFETAISVLADAISGTATDIPPIPR